MTAGADPGARRRLARRAAAELQGRVDVHPGGWETTAPGGPRGSEQAFKAFLRAAEEGNDPSEIVETACAAAGESDSSELRREVRRWTVLMQALERSPDRVAVGGIADEVSDYWRQAARQVARAYTVHEQGGIAVVVAPEHVLRWEESRGGGHVDVGAARDDDDSIVHEILLGTVDSTNRQNALEAARALARLGR